MSGDEGHTAREIRLPHDTPGHWAPKAIAAEGDHVLVADTYDVDVRVWASGDAGETWAASKVEAPANRLYISTVLRTGGKWLLAGSSAAGPAVATGEPGVLGGGRIAGGTVDNAGRPVLFGERTGEGRDALGPPGTVRYASQILPAATSARVTRKDL
ncbi:hypothetical protein ACIOD2_30790 [Amycolatopsis sp. NPDC088138]|uniref:hypothetical protein n=1 Tax=Amycolatopsis sp. NPDC088138 TaxID=3363938 RepID=UPI0038178DB8